MNVEYLEKQLQRLANVNLSETDCEDIKIKCKEAIKSLFPNDLATSTAIDRLTLAGSTGHGSYKIYNPDAFENKRKLRSILEAKIDLLKSKQSTTERNLVQSRTLGEQIEALRLTNRKLTLSNTEIYNKEKETSKRLLQVESELQECKKKLRYSFASLLSNVPGSYSNAFWAITIPLIIAILGGTYSIGRDNGYTRFDKEKIQLQAENELLLDSIKGLQAAIKLIKNPTKAGPRIR